MSSPILPWKLFSQLSILKSGFSSLVEGLPSVWRRAIKRAYYGSIVLNFDETKWPPSLVLKQLLHLGDYVIDVGANIGYVTMLLSRWVGRQGHVMSFEPVPETFDFLRYSVHCLGLTNVSLFSFALSSDEGTALMEIPFHGLRGLKHYEACISTAKTSKSSHRTIQVQTRRLDSVLSSLSTRVALIKIDVEGHEWQVVQGSRQIIMNSKPVLLIEISDYTEQDKCNAQSLFRFLCDLGYSPFIQVGSSCHRPHKKHETVDYFFLHEDRPDLRNVLLERFYVERSAQNSREDY